MSQSNRPQRSSTNATQACTNCQIRHQRCEKSSEGDINSTCTYCKIKNLHCENAPPKKRGRKPGSSGIIEAPYSCENVVSFIGQGQMPDDQNTVSINSHETTEALVNQVPTPITASINPYEITTTITSPGSSHTYNHIAIIPSFGVTDEFIGNVQALNEQNSTSINSHESFFEITGALSGHESTPNHYHINNHITTVPFFGISDAFTGQGQPLDDQDTTLINSYEYLFGTTGEFIGQGQTLDDQNTMLMNSYESIFGTTGEFIGQEPAQNHQNITPINTYEATTSNLGASYTYNDNTTFPSFGTSDVFIGQGQTLDDQNIASIINQVSIPINTSITPYKTTTEEFKSFHSNFETPYIYNHILPSEAVGAFVEQEYRQYTTPINAYETTTEELPSLYSFGSIEAIIGQGQMSDN
ncbi:17055_t:CDS:1 [Gigaspora margarita]|uniref:17055_t:CDS:1 n=1 Tax=Gigaspora margarita TaxID=4874 RepID=A0ABN7VY75_GIGMA|nr:17055_t:CDS:1 [Gigaspora margarita]